jgi:acetylornithine/N-succinyldiaminopimelate aminotransferase
MAQTTLAPIALQIEKAEGIFLFDENGKAYYDLISGISVSSLGHQNQMIVEAVKNQIDKHMHIMVYGEVIHNTPAKFSHLLASELPESLDNVYFVNSGSEAIDAAMKLAKRITGRYSFVAQHNAYHGSGQGPLSLMNDPYFTQRYRPLLNNVYYINQNDIEAVKRLPNSGVAAVVVELIQSERGAKRAQIEYIQELRNYCNATQSLLIFDEIQTGVYRTGNFVAFQDYGIVPDILVLGKAVGGGMPLACMITSTERMRAFSDNPILGHITTFGGHPVCCAAGLANLNFLIEHNKQLAIDEKERTFRECLKHPNIKEINGKGLLLACYIDERIDIIQFNRELLHKGVFTDWFLFNQNAIRIAPPLIIEISQIKEICAIITKVLDRYSF